MPLSFFPSELGVTNFTPRSSPGCLGPLFLPGLLGAPNYAPSVVSSRNSTKSSIGSCRSQSTAPNGSSIPSEESGAKQWLGQPHAYRGVAATFTEESCFAG